MIICICCCCFFFFKTHFYRVLKLITRKRNSIALNNAVRDIKNEWQPEPDPFAEARVEQLKRREERLRKVINSTGRIKK